jgi:hypothetical protein
MTNKNVILTAVLFLTALSSNAEKTHCYTDKDGKEKCIVVPPPGGSGSGSGSGSGGSGGCGGSSDCGTNSRTERVIKTPESARQDREALHLGNTVKESQGVGRLNVLKSLDKSELRNKSREMRGVR